MESLRSRPSERRKVQRAPSKLSRPPNRDARKSTRVDDKIKKRMSMRYAEISAPTDASVPAVPTIPIGLRPGALKTQDDVAKVKEQPKEDPRAVDLKLLDKDEFDPEAYLKVKLANSTEAELKSLQSSLRGLKDDVALDLKRDVFKNYAEFVLVSKEVSVLENEILEFKESLAEWKGMPSLLHIDDSASAAERRRNVRSSIADLRVLYANQMQNLHTQIEGSAKFIPTTPGRHVITEMDGIVALNSATYKVDHYVRFVLLDDSVLVARRRRRRNNAESDKLIAERCWPLNEMLVLDTKDTPSMSNVFKIRHNKETHVYRTEFPADKKNLLSQFRHVAEELAAKKRKEREGEHQRRKSLWVGGDRNSQAYATDVPPLPDFLVDFAAKADMGTTAKEKAERDARWIGDFADNLTVAIALRQWDQAVSLVEEGQGKIPMMPGLATKLPPLNSSLTAALLQSLSMPSNHRKSTVVHLISLLLRLQAGPAARNTFLNARTEAMRQRVRMITFEGHVGTYIGDLAIVMFTGIKHTADWFLASFKENEVASCFVEWAKKQMEIYAEMFRKQVYSTDVDPQTVEEAIKITHVQSKKLLEEYGLDFRFLLEGLLVEKPKETVRPRPYRHSQKPPDPIYTPAPTPIRARSPAPATPAITVSVPVRVRPPVPPVPPLSLSRTPTTSESIPSPQPSPVNATSPHLRSAAPPPAPRTASVASSRSATPTGSRATSFSNRPGTPTGQSESALRGPRVVRNSPAAPPRSRDRPGSAAGHRPPPVALPRREGMF